MKVANILVVLSLRRVGAPEPAEREISEGNGSGEEASWCEPTGRFEGKKKNVGDEELQKWRDRETAEGRIAATEAASRQEGEGLLWNKQVLVKRQRERGEKFAEPAHGEALRNGPQPAKMGQTMCLKKG
jgi:hypothetical protein